MNLIQLAQEIIPAYERHGWKLRRVLSRPANHNEVKLQLEQSFGDAAFVEAEIDALWFSRPSHAGREAWELRSIAEQPYALFEAFEADEGEEDREDARREMENMMREHTTQ